MEKLVLDKNKSLVNLANSVIKFFGCNTYHESLKEIDDLMEKSKKKKICLFLFDAFGKCILEKYKNEAPFMYNHRFLVIHSVYPATTVAATTAITTGKYPIEDGYMGWVQYFPEYNKFVEVYPSTIRDEDTLKKKSKKIVPQITDDILKTTYITNDINKKYGKEVAKMVMSFDFGNHDSDPHKTNELWEEAVDKSISKNLFTYAYNIYPDALMHINGTDSIKVKNVIIQINEIVENLVSAHPDTLFLVISDHGMIDIIENDIRNIPGFVDTLQTDTICLEERFSSFFVKDKAKFLEIYKNTPLLNEHFLLLSKKEIINDNVFGYSNIQNKHSIDTIGDFTLIALDNNSLVDKYMVSSKFKASHAGATKNEMEIYLQAYNID